MAEFGPDDAHPLRVDLHCRAVGFAEQFRQVRRHRVGGQRIAALHPFVAVQLEACQSRHDEEVAVEVGHRFGDHLQLEVGIMFRLQQMRAQQGLVEVRGHLGHKQRVVAVDRGLRLPGKIGVHGVT